MNTDIRIYHGDRIGGCVTEVTYSGEEECRILIDYGASLPGSKDTDDYIHPWKERPVNGVFFTHYHGDHIGRFWEIPDDVMLYMGETTFYIILNIHRALKDWNTVKKMIKRLEEKTLCFVERGKPIELPGGVRVTGYTTDHSAFDSYMFLVETGDTTILHTGDFRDHGHRGHVIKNGVEHNVVLDTVRYHILRNGRRKVDVLIAEGTMLGTRSGEDAFSEKQLYKWAKDYFAEERHVFLKISSTNVDSLASFAQAARSNHLDMYVNDYLYKQMQLYRRVGRRNGTHLYDFSNVKVIPKWKDTNPDVQAEWEEMETKGFVMVVNEYPYYEKIMEKFEAWNPKFIYSMWAGYIDKNSDAYEPKLADFCERHQALVKHTGGHARPELLEALIQLVCPSRALLPIHTEYAEGFEKYVNKSQMEGRLVYVNES